jgi:hypothetical protein
LHSPWQQQRRHEEQERKEQKESEEEDCRLRRALVWTFERGRSSERRNIRRELGCYFSLPDLDRAKM